MWEPLLLLSPQEGPPSMRGDSKRVTAMPSGAVGQLVTAQAAQSKVGICRERCNLALPAGFFPGRRAHNVQLGL